MLKKDPSLGKKLIRAHKQRTNFVVKDGYRHVSDLPDGRDFNRLNLKSITELTSLNDFLDTAALAQEDYISEFSNITIIEEDVSNGILTKNEKNLIASAQDKNKEILCIPRRPNWNSSTSKEVLDAMEKESFLTWRRKLAVVQEEKHIELTPFEKNLEVWRQLWRVIERSDVVVQIIDARNPLLFRCPDLEVYVKEIDEKKKNVLLLNKADFLTEHQRKCWCDYFDEKNIQIVFFSALEEMNRPKGEDDNKPLEQIKLTKNTDSAVIKNSPNIVPRENLLYFLKSVSQANENFTTVGLVGYPNVGKSSIINAIFKCKKVSVSATPGKTKHIQTFMIEKELCLCDCPGLVFPNFVSTKAEMVINGILPIDQLTNWKQPASLTSLIPRHILESTYSILISTPGDGRDSNSPVTVEEFLNSHGYSRGVMTHRGLPDNARSSRYVLKDFVNGKLLYCHAPPGMKQEDYHQFPDIKLKNPAPFVHNDIPGEYYALQKKMPLSEKDKIFFAKSYGIPFIVEWNNGKASVKLRCAMSWNKEKGRKKYRLANPYEYE